MRLKKIMLAGIAATTVFTTAPVGTVTNSIEAQAAQISYDAWVKQSLGKGIDFDGMYGVQCVDLFCDYATKVLEIPRSYLNGYGTAKNYWYNFETRGLGKYFKKIANTPSFVPKKGDVVVWKDNPYSSAGHIAIATGEGNTNYFYTYDQNNSGHNDPMTKCKHNYNYVLGVLRPKTLPAPEPNPNPENTDKKAFATSFKMKAAVRVNAYDGISGKKVGQVYVNDVITVKNVYPTLGWIKCTCPWENGKTKTIYVKMSEIKFKATKKINAYSAVSGKKVGQVYTNDTVKVVNVYSSQWMKCICPWDDGTNKTIYIKVKEIY